MGEGPGRDEDIQGEPFVGRAGKLLTQMIEAMGLRREDVYICNVVKCRPPENRLPEKDEIATCSPYLMRQLAVIQPKVICCLGSCSSQTLLQTTQGISRFRGEWFDFRGSKLIATYHPAYLLRNPTAKGEVWKDLQKVMAVLGLSESAPERALSAPFILLLHYCPPFPALLRSRAPGSAAQHVHLRPACLAEWRRSGGRRVVVPFRNRPMIGVGLAESERAPEIQRIREIVELMDRVPALPPKLIELGHWISRYYLAPIGEAFRAMLPPEVEVRHDREYSLTDAGRDYLRSSLRPRTHRREAAELRSASPVRNEAKPRDRLAVRRRIARARQPPNNSSAAVICNRARGAAQRQRAPRKSSPGIPQTPRTDSQRRPKKKFAKFLTATRGPLPLFAV